MKRMLVSMAIVAFCGATLCAAGSAAVAVTPEKPHIGETITVTYDPKAPGALLDSVKDIRLQALVLRIGREPPDPLLIEAQMSSQEGRWSAHVPLVDPDAKAVMFRFVSGDLSHDDEAGQWDRLVHGKDGAPLKAAHRLRAESLLAETYYGFARNRDRTLARAELDAENALYPGEIRTLGPIWNLMLQETPGQETKARIKADLDRLYASHDVGEGPREGNAQRDLDRALWWYRRIGESAAAVEMQQTAIEKNPRGMIAIKARLEETRLEPDLTKRFELIGKVFDQFPEIDAPMRTDTLVQLGHDLLMAGNAAKAAQVVSTIPQIDADAAARLAKPLLDRGRDLDVALEWLDRGVSSARALGEASRPSYLTREAWDKQRGRKLGTTLQMYAECLFKLGRCDEGESSLREAAGLLESPGAHAQTENVECLLGRGDLDRAIEVSLNAVKAGDATTALTDAFKRAYVKKHGSEEGFERLVQEVRAPLVAEIRLEIEKQRINKQPVEFTVTDLQGRTVSLSSVAGKVVVLDFWATWCGACLRQFPYLQKVYEKYQGNKDVEFLAVHVARDLLEDWQRTAKVKSFLDQNHYSVPVAIDSKTADALGVDAVPRIVILDRTGRIAYTGLGAEGPRMADWLPLEIDMLLSEGASTGQP